MTTIDPNFTEAPASWNTSYITPDGYVCRITLRGENGKDLLEKAAVALSFLKQHSYLPEQKTARNGIAVETRQCPIHNCSMRKFEKDGKVWFSHKTDDGAWCNGKAK